MTELEIILRDDWSIAPLQAALKSVDANQITSVSLICADRWCRTSAWDDLAAQFESWRGLRQFSIRCSADVVESTIEPPERIVGLCRRLNASLSFDFVLDDTTDVPRFLLDRAGLLSPVVDASIRLRKGGLNVRWLVPLTSHLVYRLDGIVSLAHDTQVDPVLMVPDADAESPQNSKVDRLFAYDFVAYRLLEEEFERLSRKKFRYYKDLLLFLKESAPQPSEPDLCILDSSSTQDGTCVFVQSQRANSSLRKRALRHAAGHRSRNSRLANAKSLLGDIGDVLTGGLRAHLQASIAQCSNQTRSSKAGAADATLKNVLLIGAYGGEHIGDLAILGGVLRRIGARHGTGQAVLMSQRPNHTRHLMPMLDTQVDLEVMEYTFSNIREVIAKVDGVVFAGGPLSDIPKQLVRHLYTASLARRAGKPFIVEGIGPGVFKRKPSMITAKRLVSMADRISIRTTDGARRQVIQGLPVEIGRDPAFDYLETRAEKLTRIPDFEKKQIDDLLEKTGDRLLVGLNIRPIGSFYTADAPGRDRAAYTHEVERNFEQQFAMGLQAFDRQSEKKPCFVFFPMNAIQFGMSDLRSAFRIMKYLDPGIDFRVWEADASLDGVVALIRRLDVVVSMRFHATIFALSQGRQVIGIDYRIGKRDKVAAVMSDAGQAENCCRIDQLSADWLCDKLAALSG